MHHLIDHLAEKLTQPLPGTEAQYRMAHPFREMQPVAISESATDAAVLALLYPRDQQWHIVLIERTSRHPQDRHAGQISFPGGRREPADLTLEQTALREAEEEVGVDPEQVTILGKLSELYIGVSDFLVHPYVGFSETTPTFVPQPSEVNDILQVPFDHFLQTETLRAKDMTVRGNVLLREVPYFDLQGKVLWGATAMIMSELLAIVDAESLQG